MTQFGNSILSSNFYFLLSLRLMNIHIKNLYICGGLSFYGRQNCRYISNVKNWAKDEYMKRGHKTRRKERKKPYVNGLPL